MEGEEEIEPVNFPVVRREERAFSRVVFPEPEGPIIVVKLAGGMDPERLWRSGVEEEGRV